MIKHIRIPLGFGVLKIKKARYLREEERDHKFPMLKAGNYRWIWISRRHAHEADRAGPGELATHGPRS